jgi:mono/diheme cytochrome c family protein
LTWIKDGPVETGSHAIMAMSPNRLEPLVLTGLAFAGALALQACVPPSSVPPTQARSPLPSLSTALDSAAASRGRAIALVGCASCHAIDATGVSPFAPATPFRDIVQRRSLDDIETGFAQGLVTPHPAMPPYVFRAGEIDDLIAYLGTLKTT